MRSAASRVDREEEGESAGLGPSDEAPRDPTRMKELTRHEEPTRVALVIDDSAFAIASARRALESTGWVVRATRHASAAFANLATNPPDIIVCDLHMPDISGLGVIQRVGHLQHAPPVIVLSGDDDLSAVLEAVRAGAFDYVVKTADLGGTLSAAAERAWRQARLVRENRRLGAELDQRCIELEGEVATRARTEEALRVARDQAVAGSRAKSAFLANMSHELRTPLNAILGYAELLGEELSEDNSPHVADVDRIRNAGHHLLSLISDILDLAKIEAGRQELCLHVVSLGSLIEQVRSTCAPLVAARRNRLIVSAPSDLMFTTDETKLRQCLLNLLGNASKFTENGTILLNVAEVGRGGDRQLRFDVIDTGIGMDEEQSARVFEAFEQADSSTTRKYGGTGLGLTITRRLVELLGGQIHVSSVPMVGSTFSITIPFVTGEESP